MTDEIAIINGAVLPMGGVPVIEKGAIKIIGDQIEYVGPNDALEISDTAKVIDASNCAVMPGFCNSHTHIASNMLLRGLLEDVMLFEWLSTMWRLKQNFDPTTLYWASMNGLIEMVKSGVTSFNEHFDAYAVEPQIEALKEIPLRATLGYGFADRGIYQSITDWSWRRLHTFGDVVDSHHNSRNGLLQVGLSPHATYSCGPEMFNLVREVADAHGVPIHVHLAEGPQEEQYVQENYGVSPVRWLGSLGFLNEDVTAAHCTSLDHDDMCILAETDTKIAHCPCCNAKLGTGVMPLKQVCDHGITVGIATDGPASHNTIDMFQEMKFAGIIHKERNSDVTFLKTHEILEMATSIGARAMNRPETGQLKPGMQADIIVVDLDKPHCLPVYDYAATLVYSCRADDVLHSIVGGKIVMENREVIGVDEAEIRGKFREHAHELKLRSLQ